MFVQAGAESVNEGDGTDVQACLVHMGRTGAVGLQSLCELPGASERSGGVGLGLSLVRSIAERHGGTVYCTDRLDGQSGASFVIELPLD